MSFIITTSKGKPLTAFHFGDIIRKKSDLTKVFVRDWYSWWNFQTKEEAKNKINYMIEQCKKQNQPNRWGNEGVKIAIDFCNRLKIEELNN